MSRQQRRTDATSWGIWLVSVGCCASPPGSASDQWLPANELAHYNRLQGVRFELLTYLRWAYNKEALKPAICQLSNLTKGSKHWIVLQKVNPNCTKYWCSALIEQTSRPKWKIILLQLDPVKSIVTKSVRSLDTLNIDEIDQLKIQELYDNASSGWDGDVWYLSRFNNVLTTSAMYEPPLSLNRGSTGSHSGDISPYLFTKLQSKITNDKTQTHMSKTFIRLEELMAGWQARAN